MLIIPTLIFIHLMLQGHFFFFGYKITASTPFPK